MEADSQEFRVGARLNSTSSTSGDEGEKLTRTDFMSMVKSLEIQNRIAYEEEISGLRTRVEQLQKREWELERKFLRFCDLKEQESVLMELKNILLLETLSAQFWKRTFFHGGREQKGRKYSYGTFKSSGAGQDKLLREKDSQIVAKDAEIRRNGEDLQGRSNVIKKLEDQLKNSISHRSIAGSENELSMKLETAEESLSAISKTEEEGITREEYNKLANDYEQVQKERAEELKELIYLRWCNACLTYELKRYQPLQEYIEGSKDHLEQEIEEGGENVGFRIEQQLDGPDMVEPSLGVTKGGPVWLQEGEIA
ncbi:L-O-methylthreonine resistant 1 isoform 1 [Hibiscus syriacus]|uniref:L-O-methylthreonine resistant 1 isoform 1 n=1 Tax=Hibiscus syriacus TaxID=106335 RepID=A0A6A2WXT9_HIBSY|nr:L-O-methylthreonine resistant 1 isoform 1 [Hibiscus syriacus]